MRITEIVKNNTARFGFYRQGYIYYEVQLPEGKYSFPIDLKDLGQATVSREEKAITLMRYIRKALEDGTFVRSR